MTPIDQTFNFENKQYIFQTDQNNGSYPTGQINFDLSSFANQGRYLDWSNAFVLIPLVMTLNAVGTTTQSFENDFAMSLKNGYHQLINSIQVQITNNDVVQVQNYSNLAINYEVLSSMSTDDLLNFGPTFGFYGKDTAESITYEQANTSYKGLGECNNSIVPTGTTGFNFSSGWSLYNTGNVGRRERMIYDTSFDPALSNTDGSIKNTAKSFTSSAICQSTAKNYCDVLSGCGGVAGGATTTTTFIYYIYATIPLKIIHDLFDKMHLTKNMYMRLIINTHTQCYSSIPITGTTTPYFGTTTTMSTGSQYNTVPYMISPLSAYANNASSGRGTFIANGTGVSQLYASIGIAKGYTAPGCTTSMSNYTPGITTCRVYVPTYTLSPAEEIRYLNAVPQKTIKYIDRQVYYGSNMLNVQGGTTVNAILTNGISRLKGLLIIPQISATIHGGTLTGTNFASATTFIPSTLGSPMQSPFSSSPGTCAPFSKITNFNVALSGVNWYQSNINYGFEQFQNEIRHAHSFNGGEIIGSSSGLLTKSDWENAYGFVYVNLDRRPDQSSDDTSRSVQITFTNSSIATLDYYVVLYYQREITIATATGALVI
jgi:hypothetical protein